jgi:ribosomal protein L37E
MPDRRDVRWGDRGYGFFVDNQFYLVRCGDCGRENYALAVASGQCAACGSEPGEGLKRLRDSIDF